MIGFNPNVQKLVLSRFSGIYGEPKAQNVEALCEEYHKALKGFCDEALTFGTDKAIAENVYPNWPTIGECVKACREYRSPRGSQVERGPEPIEGGETGRSDEERQVHISETMRMIADFKASVAKNNVVGKPAANRIVPDRKFFEQRRRRGAAE